MRKSEIRAFLVKHFVLDYILTIFGHKFNPPRASRIIFPCFIVTGWFCSTNDNYPTPYLGLWILYFLTAIVLYLGFVHFLIFKVKYSELDKFQKFQYGRHKPEKLTVMEYAEWLEICNEYYNQK